MPSTQEPEIATTEYWRGLMKQARATHGLTQRQLGEKVGLSQTNVSDIESGAVATSSAILAIARVLKIPPPWLALEDVLEERWLEVGRVLRRQSPARFDRWFRLLTEEVAELVDSDSDDGSGGDGRH